MVAVVVEFLESGSWVDVTGRVDHLSVTHGYAGSEPGIRSGGSLGMRSADLDTGRVRVRVSLGSRVLWEGWATDPRYASGRIERVTWRLIGIGADLAERQRAVDISPGNTVALFSSAAWTQLVGKPTTDGIVSRTLGTVQHDGPVGQFVKDAALAAGALALERKDGTVRFTNPAQSSPTADWAMTERSHRIYDVRTHRPLDAIRNIGRVRVGAITSDTSQVSISSEVEIPLPTRHAQSVTQTIALPSDGADYSNIAITAGTPTARWAQRVFYSGIPASTRSPQWGRAASYDETEIAIPEDKYSVSTSGQSVTFSTVLDPLTIAGRTPRSSGLYNWAYVGNAIVIRAFPYLIGYLMAPTNPGPPDDTAILQTILAQNGVSTTWFFFPMRYVLPVVLTATRTYEDDTRREAVTRNESSIGKWGERPLELPGWFNLAAQTAPDLSGQLTPDPPVEHEIAMPVDQADARTADVGQWIALDITDASRNVDVDATALVVQRTLVYEPARTPTLILRCRES